MNSKSQLPHIDFHIHLLRGGERSVDAAYLALVDKLFLLLKAVRPCAKTLGQYAVW